MITIKPEEAGRLDKYLVARFPDLSRTYLQRLINNRNILVDEHPASPHHKLQSGQTIQIDWPKKRESLGIEIPASLPFPILFEEDQFLIINKPPQLLSHPAGSKAQEKTIVDWLAHKLIAEEWPEGVRPGLVHRLDRDTSGILIFAKTPQAHAKISKQFANRQIKKTYFALVKKVLKAGQGTLECRMGRDPGKRQRFAVSSDGRLAVTKFKVIEKFGGRASLVELNPLTGRTHQLRVQLSTYGHPIIGDHVYGGLDKEFSFVRRQMLHAAKIKFTHPRTGVAVEFEAPLPEDFLEALKILRSGHD